MSGLIDIVSTILNFIGGNLSLLIVGVVAYLIIKNAEQLLEGRSGIIIMVMAAVLAIAAVVIWRPAIFEFAWPTRQATEKVAMAHANLESASLHPFNDPNAWPNPAAQARALSLAAGFEADQAEQILRKAYVDALTDAGVPEAEAQRKLQEISEPAETRPAFLKLMASPLSAIADPPDPLPTGMIGPIDLALAIEGAYAFPIGAYLGPPGTVIFIAILRLIAHIWKWR